MLLNLPGLYLRHVADQVRSMGGDVDGWLASGGLGAGRLQDPALELTFASFRRLLLEAVAVTREPALGLFVGERLGAASHGIVGQATLASETVREAVHLLERYTALRIPVVAVAHAARPEGIRLCVTETRPLGDIQRSVLEAVVLALRNLLATATMGACQPGVVAFPFPDPGYAVLARDIFRCEVTYRQGWAGLLLPPGIMDLSLRTADGVAYEEAARICQRELDKLSASASLASRVRRLLLEKDAGFPSLKVTARLFHMAPRTLHRRLVAEGTSFGGLLDDVRHTLAVEHLKSGRFTVEEIAFRLGYSDVANFRRAFRRWESVPPSVFRQGRGRGGG
jgi:AraC-like DNA-binding protein